MRLRTGLTLPWVFRVHSLDFDLMVRRCVDNLVRNAVEASPNGGEVSVHVQPEDDAVEVAVVDLLAVVDDDHALLSPSISARTIFASVISRRMISPYRAGSLQS